MTSAEDDLMDRAGRSRDYCVDRRDRFDMALHIDNLKGVVGALMDRVDELEVQLDEERSGVWP